MKRFIARLNAAAVLAVFLFLGACASGTRVADLPDKAADRFLGEDVNDAARALRFGAVALVLFEVSVDRAIRNGETGGAIAAGIGLLKATEEARAAVGKPFFHTEMHRARRAVYAAAKEGLALGATGFLGSLDVSSLPGLVKRGVLTAGKVGALRKDIEAMLRELSAEPDPPVSGSADRFAAAIDARFAWNMERLKSFRRAL